MTSIKMHSTLFLFALLVLGSVSAQAAFEDLSISPRSRAMGGTGIAISADAWSFNQNPALLSLVENTQISTSTMQPNGISDFRLNAIGFATKLPSKLGGVGIGFQIGRAHV